VVVPDVDPMPIVVAALNAVIDNALSFNKLKED
jgi:hypothetical protein